MRNMALNCWFQGMMMPHLFVQVPLKVQSLKELKILVEFPQAQPWIVLYALMADCEWKTLVWACFYLL